MASRVFSAEKESGGSERNSNPQPQATLLIPLPLPLTVALHDLRVLAATLFLVVGMFISPLLLAFQRDLVILGISRKFFCGDNRCGVDVGTPAARTHFAGDDKRRLETHFGSKDNGGPGSSRLLKDHGDESLRRIETIRTTQTKRSKTNLETAVEFLPRPRQRGLPLVDHWLRPKPAKTAHFFAGADTGAPQTPSESAGRDSGPAAGSGFGCPCGTRRTYTCH